MIITIHPPTCVGYGSSDMLYMIEVDGDEACVRVYAEGRGWQLLRAEGNADRITDWTFITDLTSA